MRRTYQLHRKGWNSMSKALPLALLLRVAMIVTGVFMLIVAEMTDLISIGLLGFILAVSGVILSVRFMWTEGKQ